ncbi:2-iminoacetate synthase ThiH [Telmatobacter bradus]|uniref:2-iminoacetate synthase ThiH n=1 Tax=Telmatobacter bradus TaxID=474953 RepID=UPI003B430D35
MNRTDHMAYLPDMEVLQDSTIQEDVLTYRNNYDYHRYTINDVRIALARDNRTPEDFAALLSPAALPLLEEIAQIAKEETRKHFGNSIVLFTPLYMANYCENSCTYCGFSRNQKIRRARLSANEIEKEMQAIAQTGLEEILLLTGESRSKSGLHYIGEACKIARRYFKMVGLEVYPMNTEDYTYLRSCGADSVIVFQETYNSNAYERLHPDGRKRVFPYRLNTQERVLRGGMRGVGFGALLGLDDFRKDAFATGLHAWLLQRKYPQAEVAFSCPRLRPIAGNPPAENHTLSEADLLQVILAYRLLMPFAAITISTRERAHFRDHVSTIAATKVSAGVSTGIGGHQACQEEVGDGQFGIADTRSVDEVYSALKEHGLQPVMNDYVYV